VDLTLPTIKQSIVGGEEFAERVFKAVRKKAETNRAATLAEIEEVVCRLGKVDKEMLRRPLRSMAVKRGRELFMYVARHHTEASLREIADRMGVRDISTVSHAERRVATQLTEPDAKAKELRQCLKRIYSSIPFKPDPIPLAPSTVFRPVMPRAAYFLY
jgi:chromosomal replication initiator protein